jgi:hypothetical protein
MPASLDGAAPLYAFFTIFARHAIDAGFAPLCRSPIFVMLTTPLCRHYLRRRFATAASLHAACRYA